MGCHPEKRGAIPFYTYAVALIVLVVATVFTGEVTVSSIALCVVNAVVVALAANGGYDAVSGKKTE